MTIVRVGTTKKYGDGWEMAFGKGKKKGAPAATSKSVASAKKPVKKPAKASTKKKSAAKKNRK